MRFLPLNYEPVIIFAVLLLAFENVPVCEIEYIPIRYTARICKRYRRVTLDDQNVPPFAVDLKFVRGAGHF